MGHLIRALALARAAVRNRPSRSVEIITNSPFARQSLVRRECLNQQLTVIDHRLSRHEVVKQVTQILAARRFETFVVDTFPRGLAGELAGLLPELCCRKILVHRNISRAYLKSFNVAEMISHYDLLLLPGEHAPFQGCVNAMSTAPWFIRDWDELHSLPHAHVALKVEDATRPTLVVVGCGQRDELEQYRHLAGRLERSLGQTANVRFASIDSDFSERNSAEVKAIQVWPLLSAMPAIDLLIGAGGYNTVHESRATATRLFACGQVRLYDRQAERLRPSEQRASLQELFDNSIAWAHGWSPPSRQTPWFENGVHRAVDEIDLIS